MAQNANQFDWVDFYRELAEKLLAYKNNRKKLIAKVEQIFSDTGIDMPQLEKDDQLVDIDPFTIFGLFNKASMTDVNRVKIITAVKNIFGITAPSPSSFTGIPVLHRKKATFYSFAGERKDGDIENLWNLFEAELAYAASPTSVNRNTFSKYFDFSINLKYNGTGKITMVLYWIAPDVFLNLDSRNRWYIYKSGKIPSSIVKSLPPVKENVKITASTYIEILEKIRNYLKSDESKLKDFKELSAEAFRYSQEKKSEKQSEKVSSIPDTKTTATLNADVKKKDAYGKQNFLKEVYMDEASYDTLAELILSKKNIILQGAPGVGKTFTAKRLAYSIMGVKDVNRVMMVQFHQNYSYEDFIMGFRPAENGFKLEYGAFYKFCKKAGDDRKNEYFFIIDEINRGNLSKIFGELLMLIENDKRGVKPRLLYSDEQFSVPENVYIIGMMNTADRGLAMLDYALRRRFAFYEMKPGFDSDGFREYREGLNSERLNRLIACVEKLNEVIAEDCSLGEGFCIGHSFFCELKEANAQKLSAIVEYEIIPLLKEYWFDEPEKVKDWAKQLREAIK